MAKNGKFKFLIILLIVIIIFILFKTDNEENIRIRIIANSNDIIDLYHKEEVKKIVLSVINADDQEIDIINKIPKLEILLNEYCNNKNINFKISYTKCKFPPKKLNEKVVSGGYYKTLLITLGNGFGNNYWTLLYPDYYGITFEEVYSGEVEIKSYFYELFKDLLL